MANAGSYSIGQCDDINQLNQLCYTYRMWMHLEGVYLSTLILYSVPTEIQPVSSGDSITLNLPTWLGVPSLSYIVNYLKWKKKEKLRFLFIFKNEIFNLRPYTKTCQDLRLIFSRSMVSCQLCSDVCLIGAYYRHLATTVCSSKLEMRLNWFVLVLQYGLNI